MRIGIIGAGAIGLLLASALPKAADIHLITRTKGQAAKIREQGIHRDENKIVYVSKVDSFADALAGPTLMWDWAILALKQPHLTDELLEKLNVYVAPNTRLICFQNGLGHLRKVHTQLAPRRIYAAVSTEGALKQGPHQVRWTGYGHTWLGRVGVNVESSETDEKEYALLELFRDAGISVDLSNQIVKMMWHKLLINCVINPITAIFSKRNGELLESPYLLQLMRTLLDEAMAVSAKEGMQEEAMWEQLLTVCKRTAQNKSSMYMDLLHNRKTEIEWINGFLINKAVEHNLFVETHQAVFDLIKEIEVGGTVCRS